MTDEKMIKEMAKCMCSSYESGKGCNTCPTNWCYADECATMAFCNGYRKLHKNAVVLTKEEFEKNYVQRELYEHIIKHRCLPPEFGKIVNEAKDQARKETVREIVKYLMQFEGYATYAGEELAERYGVKIEE